MLIINKIFILTDFIIFIKSNTTVAIIIIILKVPVLKQNKNKLKKRVLTKTAINNLKFLLLAKTLDFLKQKIYYEYNKFL